MPTVQSDPPRGTGQPLDHPMSEPAHRMRPVPSTPSRRQRALALCLFGLTFFSATTLGSVWWVSAQTGISTTLELWLTPATVSAVWSDPSYLLNGLAFSIPLLVILLSHELGHYVICRRYGLPATLPFFLPAPLALGTLGAFIRIRAPIRDRRQLLDIGAGGPIAGFVVLLPFLFFGLARSEIAPVIVADPPLADAVLFRPGEALLMKAVVVLMHGHLAPNEVLNLHPVALAAWVGLLATSLNLLPIGQLDGGHIVYAALGRLQRKVAIPLWLCLAACGLLWFGWIFWCLVVLLLGLRHPPVLDDSVGLDRRRLIIALIAALVFALSFIPIPVSMLWVVA